MSELEQVMQNLSEGLKEPEKNFVNFPLKDLPQKATLLAEILENPAIRESMTEEEVKIFKEKVIVKLLNRLLVLNEVNQKDASLREGVLNMLYLLQKFFKRELEEEKEPNSEMMNSFEHLYNMAKPFYQNNHYEPEPKPSDSADSNTGANTDDKTTNEKQTKEQADKLREDPFESNKDETQKESDGIEPWENTPTVNDLDDIESLKQNQDAIMDSSEGINPFANAILRNGMRVDCKKFEPDCDELDGIWATGTIHGALEGAAFRVSFDRDDDKYDRIIYVEDIATEIYPEDYHSYLEMDWRIKLKNNSGSGVMASMTNLDETIDQVLLQVTKVPLGKSKNYGIFKDNEFPQLSIRSPLIRKRGSKFDSRSNEEIELQELNNPGKNNIQGPIGPHSVRKGTGKHTVLKLVIKEYFEIGLDQVMIEVIKGTDNPIPLKLFMKILEYYVRIKRMTPEEHKGKYENEFEVAIEEFVKSENLSKSIKEFKYEYFGTIFTANKTVVMDAAQKCLQSDSLSTRVNGIKYLDNICTKCIRGNSSDISRDDAGEWISKNEVIENIFGTNHHSELISRSENILKVLCRSKTGLKENEMNLIWNLTKRDNQTKGEIYGILQTVGESLGKDFIEYILDKILSYKTLTSADLSFMFSFKNKTQIQTECIWKILNNIENYTEDVVQTAYEKIIDSAKFAALSLKGETIDK